MKVGNITLMAGAQIKNLRGEKLAVDPALETLVASQEAMLWYNTTEKVYKFFNGTSIELLGGSGGGEVDLSGLVKADGSVAMTGDLELSSADQTGADSKAAVSKGHVDTLLASKLSVSAGALTADLSAGGFGISNLAAPVNPTDAARKVDIENALSGMNWKEDIDALQSDDVLQPQKVAGKRYVLTNVALLHADFGTIDGAVNNVIVQYDGEEFVVVFTPTEDRAEGAIAWNSETNQYVRFDGTAWSTFGGMASVTAGAGLAQSGNELSIKTDADGGVVVGVDGVGLKLNGSSLDVSADGVKVADGGIGFTQIDSAVFGSGLKRNTDTNKIEIDNTAIKAAGFIDQDGGEVASLILTGEVQEVDNAVATRKFVEDSLAGVSGSDENATKSYMLDSTASAETSITFTHNAGQRFGSVAVFDESGKLILPDEITLVDENSLTVTLVEATKVFIIFVAGKNQYSSPVAPEPEPAYQLIVPTNIGPNSAGYLFLVPNGEHDYKSRVFSVVSGGASISSSTEFYCQLDGLTVGTKYTFQCVVTKTDDTTETVTVDYTHATTATNLTLGGHKGTGTSVSSLKSIDRPSLGAATDNTVGIDLYNSTLDSGLSIVKAEYSLEPIGTRYPIDYSKISVKMGTNKTRVNVVSTLSTEELAAVGINRFLTLIGKFTLSDGSVIYPMDITFTCQTSGSPVVFSGFSDAQLNS